MILDSSDLSPIQAQVYYEGYMEEKRRDIPGHTVFLSLTLVFLVTVGVFVGLSWYINKSFPKPPEAFSSPVTTGPRDLTLNVNTPEDLSVVFDKQLTIAGQTLAKATVVISTEDEDFVSIASAKGSFSKDLILVPGLNTITVTVLNDRGDIKQTLKRIYLSGEQL